MLPRSYRLARRADFSRVYAMGKTVACPDFILYRYKRRGSQVRIGFSSSKKIGGAVQRNRARRIFRHAAAEILEHFSGGADYVFVIRTAGAGKTAPMIQRSMLHCIQESGWFWGSGNL